MKILGAVFFLLGIAMVGMQISGAQVYLWSGDAQINGNIDPNINWVQGMPASATGNSARNTLARIAQWRDDQSGHVPSSTYSGTTYSVTTNQVFTSLAAENNMTVCFFAASTNQGGDFISFDGQTAIPIYAGGSPVNKGVIIQSSPYCVGMHNNVANLRNYYANFSDMPVGTIIDYAGSSVPSSEFALAGGQCISSTTYASLASLLGNTYGICGSGTFGLPDARSRTLTGVSNMGGSESSRLNVACQTSLGYCGAQNQTIAQGNLPNYALPSSLIFSGNSQTVGLDQGAIVPNGSVDVTNAGGGVPAIQAVANDFQPNVSITPAGGIGGGVSLGGSGVPLQTVQPTMMIFKIIRVQ